MARTGVASHDGWPRTRSPRATWQDGPAGGMAGLPPVRGHGGRRRRGGARRGRSGGRGHEFVRAGGPRGQRLPVAVTFPLRQAALSARGSVAHGAAVLPKPGGGYQTVAFQNGKVTAVSSTSITLRSADGYSRTYRVTSSTLVNAQRDGIGSVKAGNQ